MVLVRANDGRSSSKYTEDNSKSLAARPSSKRAASKNNKNSTQGRSQRVFIESFLTNLLDVSPPSRAPARKQKKKVLKNEPTSTKEDEETTNKPPNRESDLTPPPMRDENNDGDSPDEMDEDDRDPFAAALFGAGRGPSSGLSSTLRALSGMMSGMSSRLRDILNSLRRVDDPTMQLVALEELSNLLLVSNEDNLSGQFSPDPYVKELVALMQPNPLTGEENPEMMLLACRCIANLMEALRGSVANVVYGGAVPVLCQKLLDIQYIDVAEQALSTLSKISIDFPGSIVREGGLTACLQFLDFFATGTQRTAVITAANCCRNIPHDSFPVIRDVMPILQNVLASHDQKVVEQGCLCVIRVIDSFRHSPNRLEQLIEPQLLRAVLGLLLPGSTNLVGANIHTDFLRTLAIVARASPKLSAELLKMNVVDTLYQILTGVSPPAETADAASKIDSVVVMQALIHRPREQIYEALNVICELLPRAKTDSEFDDDMDDDLDDDLVRDSNSAGRQKSRSEKRLELLQDCKDETRRFAMILLPTLTDAYSSTVNLSVRQKVLTAQLKILSNLETSIIEEALRPVPYASYLASILSQEDHPSLVMFALQASELLFERLEDIYQYQFHREGVIGEIKKLADRSHGYGATSLLSNDGGLAPSRGSGQVGGNTEPTKTKTNPSNSTNEDDMRLDEDDAVNDEDGDDDDSDNEDGEDGNDEDIVLRGDAGLDDSESSESSDGDATSPVTIAGVKDLVIIRARKFVEKYDTPKDQELKARAIRIREDLQQLAKDISACYSGNNGENGKELFGRLAQYFDGDALESITSSELLDSGIIRVLVDVLANSPAVSSSNPRADFLASFMRSISSVKVRTATATNTPTALSVLVQKLQDLLSRAEHFEVLTVNSNAFENSRSSATSMLSRQIRLKLTADPNHDVPVTYRELVVSIHAIATFKALDEYLRPRLSISERPSSSVRRRNMLEQLANARMAQLSGAADSGLFSPFGSDPSLPPSLGTNEQARPSSRPSSRSKPSSQENPTPDENKPVEKHERRRSGRRAQAAAPQAASAPDPSSEAASTQLECADEKTIEDEHPTDDAEEALDAVVGAIEDEMSDEDMPEPSAINMEVASTGKVTARQEDGTRVFTPLQPGTPVSASTRPPSSEQAANAGSFAPGLLAGTNRPSSYAAALASIPQDWHIEFSIDGKVIPSNTTIYRAVHHNREQPQDLSSRTVWAGIHAIKFKKVKGPPPVPSALTSDWSIENKTGVDGLPPSLDGHPTTSSILSLLGILHDINDSLDDARELLGRMGVVLYAEPLASFINTKLTAKMNRQLEEPLIVASNCLPDWSEDLARTFPFLFPFETRYLFLQSTSFGYSRSMARWQSSQNENDERRDRRRDDRPLMGRPQRQKVRISRNRILESALKVMEIYGASPSMLEVEYFEEVGTGLGPTLEFYATVSKEFSKKKLKLWRENDAVDKDVFAFGKNGLFPAPMSKSDASSEGGKKLLHVYKMLGKFVARSMLDSRIIDLSFNATFFKTGGNRDTTPSIATLRTVDHDLANSMALLQQFATAKANIEVDSSKTEAEKTDAIRNFSIHDARVEDLMLDFTLPGYPTIDLIEGGSDIAVSMDNINLYIERVLDMTLGSGVRPQIEAFQAGFSQVFSYSSLKAFTANELVMLFGRVDEDWSMETLTDSIKADHGFNMDSKSIKNLLQTMCEFTKEQRRDFLQFVTGSPKLPIGGFKSLTPMFTVVCKPSEPPYSSDDYLPSVMTCVNYLKLPDYSTQEVLKRKLIVATKEGQGAFHLS